MTEPRIIALGRPDTCIACGGAIAAGLQAEWNAGTRRVTCLACLSQDEHVDLTAFPAALDRGSPGASAKRRHDLLRERREDAARKKFGRRLGRVYLAFTTEPQSARAWSVGSRGERVVGEYLESLHDGQRVIVLHDRKMPGSRANIDHIAICRSGVYVVDAKNYAGKVERIDKGGWFSTDLRLYVGRRDCTSLASGVARQAAIVRDAASEGAPSEVALAVKPMLCFVGAEWSLFAEPFRLNDVWIGWPKALGQHLLADGPLEDEALTAVADHLASVLPVA
jgi:hypothetical protein